MTQSTEETFPPSKCSGARPKKPLTICSWPRSNTPPLREVILPQIEQTPYQSVRVPPYDKPPEPWRGFGSQDQLMCEDEEHNVTNTIKLIERKTKTPDPIEDMEKYIHTVLNSNDEEAKKCKLEHNTALAMNTQVHIINDNHKHLSDLDKGKIKEMEKN